MCGEGKPTNLHIGSLLYVFQGINVRLLCPNLDAGSSKSTLFLKEEDPRDLCLSQQNHFVCILMHSRMFWCSN